MSIPDQNIGYVRSSQDRLFACIIWTDKAGAIPKRYREIAKIEETQFL
jgi:hypothetical protein